MACPMSNNDLAQAGVNMAEVNDGLLYGEYLQLDKVLDAQRLISAEHNNEVYDEHLFIITHQAYELWFKQLLFEIDSIRRMFLEAELDERRMLEILKRAQRCVLILKLLADQVQILETMTPLDFMEFRHYLSPASGFQSLQFRLLENKLGVHHDSRARYNQQHYLNVFPDEPSATKLTESVTEPSLCDLIQIWLERTPGLEGNSFNFWNEYQAAVNKMFSDEEEIAQKEPNEVVRKVAMANISKRREQFQSVQLRQKPPKKKKRQALDDCTF